MIAVAHLGLFLLLTASARSEVATLEERYGPDRLAASQDPGPRPADPVAVSGWLRSQAVWEGARRHGEQSGFVGLLGYGLLASFLVQAGVTGVLLHRSMRGRRHASQALARVAGDS